jgi:hypothetical protein
MKDPCLECLVQVTCWQECDDKRNYATLLANAIRNYRGQTRFNTTYQKQFRTLMKQSEGHIVRRNKINRRSSSMSKDK